MKFVRRICMVASVSCAALLPSLLAHQASALKGARSDQTDRTSRLDLSPFSAANARGRRNGIRGYARVIDGDTLDVDGVRVRLEGIDAPEIKQTCSVRSWLSDIGVVSSATWPAGKVATSTLARWVKDRPVTCRVAGRDGYGRVLGHCETAERNLNAAMIENGLAWAFVKYSRTYVAEERAARRARNGIWATRCETAWSYRKNRWSAVQSNAPSGCAIKGNITRSGRIYHMPWSPWYSRTRIEPGKGERWFCDERQALAAGWRPAAVR